MREPDDFTLSEFAAGGHPTIPTLQQMLERDYVAAHGDVQQRAMDGSAAMTLLYNDKNGLVREGPFGYIKWQLGPVPNGINGATIEDVLGACIERLEGFQAGPFACIENAQAIGFVRAGVDRLLDRTAARAAQGVEGTNAPHQSA